MEKRTARRLLRAVLFVASCVPLGLLVADAARGELGANPIEAALNRLGYWTLVFVLLALGPTPLQTLLGWRWLARYRRMIGLFAFFYACLHLTTYLWLDQFFDWSAILDDIAKRPYITVGFAAFLLMVPLAVTSTRAMVRRLGRRWQALHRLVYLVAGLGVLHFLWLVKADHTEPAIYGAVLLVLLALRLPPLSARLPGRRPRPAPVT